MNFITSVTRKSEPVAQIKHKIQDTVEILEHWAAY